MAIHPSELTALWSRIVEYVKSYVNEYDRLAVATEMTLGQVRPDGTTIIVDDDGTIHAASSDDDSIPDWAKEPNKPSYTADEVGALPDTTAIPSKVSDLTNDSGFITTEADPTVPPWAKEPNKPMYTADEVGALPDTTAIPSKTSDLANDSGFISTEADPTVPSWAKEPNKPSYTADEVGALPDTTAIPSKVSDLTNDSGFITSIPVATNSTMGIVKPDGVTITSNQGTINVIDVVRKSMDPHWEIREHEGSLRLAIVIPEGT